MLTEKAIAPRRAIAANDVDLAVNVPQLGQQVMQEIELSDVIVLLVTCTVVAKKMVQRRNAFRKILIAYPVNHIQMFSGVKVKEAKPIRAGICWLWCVYGLRSGKERESQRSYETGKHVFL